MTDMNCYDLTAEQAGNTLATLRPSPKLNYQLFVMVLHLGTHFTITSMLYCPFKMITDYTRV